MPSGAPDAQLLEAEGLHVRFPHADRTALDVAALHLNRGESVAITGPSGCGKTTLVHALCGIIPDVVRADLNGRVRWAGVAWETPSLNAARAHVAMMAQSVGAQLVALSVADEIAFALQSRQRTPDEIDAAVAHALAEGPAAGLAANDKTLFLSGGWRQRLALAAAAAEQTDCLVLDEPFAHLDPDATQLCLDLLHRIRRAGTALLLVEHRVAPIHTLVDRVIVMNADGTIAASGTPSEILIRVRHEVPEAPRAAARPQGRVLAEVRDASLALGGRTLFQNLGATFHAGEIVGIVGPNGAGKSSFGLMLCGAFRPSAGSVKLVAGTRAVMVPQNPELFFATGRLEDEAARFGLSWAAFEEAATRLGVPVSRGAHPLRFSHGEKRRLAIALASASPDNTPRVIIVDEPQSALDDVSAARVSDLLCSLADQGHAVIVIAHDRDWLDTMADRIMRFGDGPGPAVRDAA